jgi:hypothetical protein
VAQLTLSSYATTIGETATAVRRTTAIPTTCRKKRVVQNSAFNFSAFLRQERTGGAVSIAVESTNTSVVYVSWCDSQNGVYHPSAAVFGPRCDMVARFDCGRVRHQPCLGC